MPHGGRTVLPAFLACCMLLAQDARSQSCPNPGDTFWKNDKLPQNPSGLTAVSVIAGICPGEAAGSVFDLAPGMGPQRINKVGIGFGSQGGIPGKQANVNVEVYDGIQWSGNLPVLGTKVFDLQAQLGGPATLQSQGINEVDLSGFDVVVGSGTSGFVVVARVVSNTNGSCAFGYNASLITDGTGGACSATPKKNVMFVLGQGWIDPSNGTVSGFPLCPLFYNGNWLIRACTSDAATCQQDLGFAGPGDARIALCGDALGSGGFATFELTGATPNSAGVVFASPFFNPSVVPALGGTLCPIPPLASFTLPIGPSGGILVPNVPGGGGPALFYVQMVTPDATQPKGYEVTNALGIQLLP